ncbi:MAG TPA: type IV pilus secretin PilQ [Vulgatibacter sp.]|nr:type IV pilus secretin PilQ [Vulgatibacter sp.]
MSQVFNRGVGAVFAAATLLFSVGATAGDGEPAGEPLGPNVVVAKRDEATVRHPASRLVDARVSTDAEGTRIELKADGDVGTFDLLELKDPPRLAIDLHGVGKAAARARRVDGRELAGIRYGVHEGKLRVVLDADPKVEMPAYRVERISRGLRVTLDRRVEAAPVMVAESAEATPAPVAAVEVPVPDAAPVAAPIAVASAPEAKPAPAAAPVTKVLDVAFKGDADKQNVQIELSRAGRYEVTRPNPSTLVLTLERAQIPQRLVRSLDASAYAGPIRTISSFSDPASGDVRVVVALAHPADDRIEATGNKLVWSFQSNEVAEIEIVDEATGTIRVAADDTETVDLPVGPQRRKPVYTGRRVSFEFKDIDIHNLLRVIAEVSKRNIVVADDVRGSLTIRLRNVPWDQALDLILKSKGLGKEVTGNIIRIAPLRQILAEQEQAAKATVAREDAMPLRVRIIPVNYALAKDVEGKVKNLLTKRGSVVVDARTNTLIVKDISEAIARVEALIRSLDTQTPQVLIAARIVEASSNFKREIGIQWGGNLTANASMGNATGLAFPNNVNSAGSIPGAVGAGGAIPAQPNWAVSFPAAVAQSSGGAVGFSFGSAGGAALLNLRLTALETQGLLKTVSAPKVTTLDNTEAVIGQGVSIPFSQVSAAGVNTVFVEAKLELRVTPHVTSDGSILMKIRASNNQPSENITGANGQPAITKREAQTEVLVKDGDTTVIGGIYTRRTSEKLAQVPLFGDIPILGWLFKSDTTTDDRTELLIFVSPTIVNREASVVAGG